MFLLQRKMNLISFGCVIIMVLFFVRYGRVIKNMLFCIGNVLDMFFFI